jgi:hypothetical protein
MLIFDVIVSPLLPTKEEECSALLTYYRLHCVNDQSNQTKVGKTLCMKHKKFHHSQCIFSLTNSQNANIDKPVLPKKKKWCVLFWFWLRVFKAIQNLLKQDKLIYQETCKSNNWWSNQLKATSKRYILRSHILKQFPW